jgi:hypothetical protein
MPTSTILSEKLAKKVLGKIDTPRDWHVLWDRASTLEEHLSLLHWGLRNFISDEKAFLEQVCFYLEVADGYRGLHATQEEKKTVIPVAQAAWKELCLHFFDKKMEADYLKRPEDIPVMEKLIWFFDLDQNDNVPSYDVGFGDHIRRIGANLWRNFYWNAWRGTADSYEIKKEDREALRPTFAALHALRPKLVPKILHESNGAEILLSLPARADTLPYLRHKALEERWVYVDTTIGSQERRGPYTSLQEAIQAGREVAEVCLILETRLG